MALQDQLYAMYVAKIYPVLVKNDPRYRESMFKAGLGWNPTVVTPASRASFEQEMKMQAWLGASKIDGARSLQPDSIQCKVLDWSMTLYRVAEAGSITPPGIWWFTDQVAKRCRDAAGSEAKKQLEWLRNVLAVCYDWSTFDRIERFTLHANESIPAVLGTGLPMPYYKRDPKVDRETGERVVPEAPPDYWKKQGLWLMGGEQQVVLPWIPVMRIATTDSL